MPWNFCGDSVVSVPSQRMERVCAKVEAPLPHPHYNTTYNLLWVKKQQLPSLSGVHTGPGWPGLGLASFGFWRNLPDARGTGIFLSLFSFDYSFLSMALTVLLSRLSSPCRPSGVWFPFSAFPRDSFCLVPGLGRGAELTLAL